MRSEEASAAHTHEGRNNHNQRGQRLHTDSCTQMPCQGQRTTGSKHRKDKHSFPKAKVWRSSEESKPQRRTSKHRGKVLDIEQDVLTGPQAQVSPEEVCSSETHQPSRVISTVKPHSETGIGDEQGKSQDQCLPGRNGCPRLELRKTPVYQRICGKQDLMRYVILRATQNSFSP